MPAVLFASNRPTENPNAAAAECNSGRSGGVEPLRQRRNGRDAVVAYAPTRKPRAVAPTIDLPNGGVDRVRPAQRSRDARAEPEPEIEAAGDKLHTEPFVVDTEPRGSAGLPEPMASGLAGDHRGDAAGSTRSGYSAPPRIRERRDARYRAQCSLVARTTRRVRTCCRGTGFGRSGQFFGSIPTDCRRARTPRAESGTARRARTPHSANYFKRSA